MSQGSFINGNPADPVVQHILRRLDRIEKRLRAIERDKKNAHLYHHHHHQQYGSSFGYHIGDHVSIIGVKEVASSKHIGVKVLWLLFFVVCLSCMGFFVYKTFREYWDDPTATKVKLVEQTEYDYPAILLCPDTWLDAEKATNDGLSTGGLQYALGFLINYITNPPSYKIEDYEQAQYDFETYYNRRGFADLVQFFKFISLDSTEFFYHCPFCRNQSFEKIIMSDSVCYQVPMQATPGNAPIVSTLDTLDVVVPDRSGDFLRRRSFWKLYLGLDLLLGEATLKYAEIYPHQTNTVQFVTHRFVSVKTPENPCLSPDEAERNYSYARCVLQCYTEGYDGKIFLMTACSLTSTTDCQNERLQPNVTFQFYSPDLWEQLNEEGGKGQEAPDHCYKRCPSFCERMIYSMDVQSHAITPIIDLSDAPPTHAAPPPQSQASGDTDDWEYRDFDIIGDSKWSSDSNSSSSNADDSRRRSPRTTTPPKSRGIGTPPNLTRVSFLNSAAVYGGVLTFEEISTYSFETMVGNVGGMLSLWMGISIMSLIQLVMFICSNWFSKRKMAHVCKRSSTCGGDSAVSPTMNCRTSPVAGTYYSRTNGEERSSIV